MVEHRAQQGAPVSGKSESDVMSGSQCTRRNSEADLCGVLAMDRTSPEEPAEQSEVFAFLADPATHGICGPVRRIDTHAAAVFLAGSHAYKVKRAVRYAFMDFSSLAKRRAACAKELAVNRPNASDLYLGLVPITKSPAGLAFGGDGEVVEWAVQMRRFDENRTLDRLAERGELGSAVMPGLAAAIVAAHRAAPQVVAPGTASAFRSQMEQVLDGLARENVLSAPAVLDLTAKMRAAFTRVEPLLQDREAHGDTRRCHGDLHLGNIVMVDDRPVLFDAIEFDDQIATCDVLYDLAFALMDLWTRGLHPEASSLLSRYMWLVADVDRQLAGLAALPLFLALRAAIRTEVTLLRQGDRTTLAAQAQPYLDAAGGFLEEMRPVLVGVGGLSGTGKSALAAALAPELGRPPGAIHLRSDIERKRLAHQAELDRLPDEAYLSESSTRTYERLRGLAGLGLAAGQSVIVDATHRRSEDRVALREVAGEHGVRFVGLWLEASTEVRLARVSVRLHDASDAGPRIAAAQDHDEVGALDWSRIDGSGPLEDVSVAARVALHAA
jgi:aminoglycoside phosphotransferase family enzyme/predicted kinase